MSIPDFHSGITACTNYWAIELGLAERKYNKSIANNILIWNMSDWHLQFRPPQHSIMSFTQSLWCSMLCAYVSCVGLWLVCHTRMIASRPAKKMRAIKTNECNCLTEWMWQRAQLTGGIKPAIDVIQLQRIDTIAMSFLFCVTNDKWHLQNRDTYDDLA